VHPNPLWFGEFTVALVPALRRQAPFFAKEALLLTGEEDPERAAQAVHAIGPRLVLLTHQGGVCVCDGPSVHRAAFSGRTPEGRTGRGDTCTASFLAGRRRGTGLADATAFAAAVTSEKMRSPGPYRGPAA
jgi:sugar/nucleoside kinase (ribokinase family)